MRTGLGICGFNGNRAYCVLCAELFITALEVYPEGMVEQS
jgi:hypothetical protein